MDKHPIGIMPRDIWEYKVNEERLNEILLAMERFEKAGIEIPKEWYKEYLDLTLALELVSR